MKLDKIKGKYIVTLEENGIKTRYLLNGDLFYRVKRVLEVVRVVKEESE
jgi:hypothetical protein